MRYLIFWQCLLTLVTTLVSADGNWTKPNGLQPSFTDTYTVGERIFISWMELNSSINDLWLTRYDPRANQFALRLQVARNISYAGNFEWTIAVNATEIAQDTRFLLQFLPANSAYDPTKIPQLPSPAFNLILLNQISLPNGTVGAPSITPSSTAAVQTSSITSSSSSSRPTQDGQPPEGGGGPSLTRSVAIGVAIGAALLVLGTMIGAFFMVQKYKRTKPIEVTDSSMNEFKITGPYEVLGTSRQPSELSSKETMMHEMNASKESVVHNSSPNSPVYEMSTTIKRPGLHEMPG